MIVDNGDARIAVVTINYNGLDDTLRLLKQLSAIPDSVSVVVVDNDSLEKPDLLKQLFPEVQLILSPENIGFGRGNNLGVESLVLHENRPEFVYILNNDTVPDPGSINALSDLLDQDDSILCAAPLILYPDRETIWFAGGDFSFKNVGATSPFKDKQVSLLNTPGSVMESPFISGCAMFMRVKDYMAHKGFDPRFFMYVEDVDFSYRVSRYGRSVVCLNASIIHYAHSSIGTSGDNPLSLKNRNLGFYITNVIFGSKLYLRKNFSGFSFLFRYAFLFVKWQRNGVRLGIRGYLYVNKVWWRGGLSNAE